MGYNNGVPVSNKTWRKTHLFDGEWISKVSKIGKAMLRDKIVDKNNHKVELVIINDKPYRK